jgi:hypothetical protein
MSHRKKAICEHCGTVIEFYAFPHHRWIHVELELEHTAGHTPQPEIDRGTGLSGLNYASARR